MQIAVPKDKIPNPLAVLRKAGYSSFVDPNTKQVSYVLRLSGGFYPRFHLYVEERGDKHVFNLHLDQTQPTYGDGTAHKGEYDGPTVEKELRRIEGWIRAAAADKHLNEQVDASPKEQQKTRLQSLTDWFFG